tara:strand:+ start:10583 stop:12148 length:1566 start_codon:yes stop_codon:yes gene_type:complete
MDDLGKTQKDYAVYLPAISSFYTKQLDKICNKIPDKARVPAGFEHGNEGLDFLKNDNSYYHYPYGLYSAGHAHLDITKSHADEPMIQDRDRNTVKVLLGDSGGFQIATGVMKMDWANAKDPNDPARTAMCEKILRWLEHTADWSMTLDIPAFAAVEPLSSKTGLTEFSDTLDISLLNLDYFVRNRVPGATKFLNVLSGTDESTSKEWYEGVKHFSDPTFTAEVYGEASRALEGYAFAGINMKDLSCVLNRILDLRADGLLAGKDWIHFLGTGKLQWACFLTAIQRQLRLHDNPNITLSFDAASPFVNTAYGQTYAHNFFEPGKFGYFMDRAFDQQELVGSTLPAPFGHSPVMSRLTMGDLCTMAAGDQDKNGNFKFAEGQPLTDKEGKPKLDEKGDQLYAERDSTTWDTQTYLYYMGHSVYNHITAVQEANRLADVENTREAVDFTHWKKPLKKSSKAGEVSPYVPVNIFLFRNFVETVLDPATTNAREIIASNKEFLTHLSMGGEDDGTKDEVMDTFFEF